MGQRSSIEKLDPDLRKRLVELLADPNVTQQAVADVINAEAGERVVSKSAVNRYAKKMARFAERNKQAREVADLYLEKYGEERQNKLGKIINEQVRMVAFDLLINLEEIKEDETNPEHLADLAFIIQKVSRSIKDLEQAATVNAEREKAIRHDALVEAAAAAEETAKASGLSADAVERIKRQILGL